MRYLSIIIGLAVSLVLSGCVTPQSSGPATTYITKAVPLEKVKSEIIQVYTSGGWNMERETDHMITFVIENKNPMAQLFMSSQYDSRVFDRETIIITDSDQGVSLTASQAVVSNYGSAFEHSQSGGSPHSQERLNAIRNDLMQ